MKKTVNVNIASQPFTLDEDAYEALESYLDDIAARLPVSDTGSMDNIESRIARLFDARVKAGSRIISLHAIDEAKGAIGLPESFGRRRDDLPSHADTSSHVDAEQIIEDAEVVVDRPSGSSAIHSANHVAPVSPSFQPAVVEESVQAAVVPAQSALPVSTSEPEPEQPYDYPTHLYRSRDERMLAGVCGGLSKYLNYPVSTVRAVTVILALPALLSVFAYFILWYLLPEEPLYDKNGKVIDTDNR